MEKRSVETDFGEAIGELKKRKPSRRFWLESRHLGAVLDARALLGMGWHAVESQCGGKWLWHGCLWFERRVQNPEGNGEALVRLGTSGFRLPPPDGGADMGVVPDGKETEALLQRCEGNKPALAYLRTVAFLREEEGGLRVAEWEGDLPEWALGPVDAELAERQCRKRLAPNPEGIDIAARIGDTIHRYRVFKAMGDDASPDEVPEEIEALVVKIRDAGERYVLEYKGFPEEGDNNGNSDG